jgi:hypothetical protein
LFSLDSIRLSDAFYDNKRWLEADLSTHGYSFNDALLAVEIDQQPVDDKLYAESHGTTSAKKPTSLFSFITGNKLKSPSIPDPSPLWSVGLLLGITGVTWRVLNLTQAVHSGR